MSDTQLKRPSKGICRCTTPRHTGRIYMGHVETCGFCLLPAYLPLERGQFWKQPRTPQEVGGKDLR